jgi:hypothetical protein
MIAPVLVMLATTIAATIPVRDVLAIVAINPTRYATAPTLQLWPAMRLFLSL